MFLPGLFAGIGSSALGIGATLLSSVGTLVGGIASQQAANYNAKVQEMQAKVAEDQAAAKYAELRTRNRQRLAQSAAAVLESGFELGGSFKDMLEQTAAYGELDALSAIYEGNVRATGYRNSAALNRFEGKQARTASIIGAGTKLISGVADVYRNKGASIVPWRTSIVPSSAL